METIFSVETINYRVYELGKKINLDYRNKALTAIVLMTGGMFFAADLIRQITTPLWVDSLNVSSYDGKESSKQLKFRSSLKMPITNRHVLLIDEVFDTGFTIELLRKNLMQQGALSVKAAVAVVKELQRPENITIPEYYCFNAPNRFLIGYGMDYNEDGRQIPFIGALE